MLELPQREDGSIDLAKLNEIVGDYENLKQDMDDTRSQMGHLLKDGEDTYGLHRAAFKLAVKIKNESVEKRADFLRAFDLYRRLLVLDDQPDMLQGSGAGE